MTDRLTNYYTGWRFNPEETGVENHLEFLIESSRWTLEQIKKYQFNKLKETIQNAYENTQYYRNTLEKLGINPGQIKIPDDLKTIPFIEKETIKKNYDAFISKKVNKVELYKLTSGGSTGNPMEVFYDDNFNIKDRASTFFNLWLNKHHPLQSKSVRLHGDPIPEEKIKAGEYSFVVNGLKLVLSSQHINRNTCPDYVNQISQFKPAYIHAYPSAIFSLCKLMAELNLLLRIKLDCVYCDSEMLYPGQKEFIESFLSCPVIQTYGHTEGCVCGISLKNCPDIHILPQVGYVEIIDAQGNWVTEPGKSGEIVVTGFYNEVFPLIRYKTSDIATLTNPRDNCQFRFFCAIKKIEGRKQDFAIDKEGNSVPVAPALFDYNIDWSGVQRFQIQQEKAGCLIVRVELTRKPQKKSSIIIKLQRNLATLFGKQFEIKVASVQEIPVTGRGKFRYFIQKIKG
ncbi:phenylacetate--CoA ligase family protein [Candidatus Riflebacteria bacterium]